MSLIISYYQEKKNHGALIILNVNGDLNHIIERGMEFEKGAKE
jgi:DNA integrity scanning protein DisA with diadenylate cyclase activity